jgi:hypothetical protein
MKTIGGGVVGFLDFLGACDFSRPLGQNDDADNIKSSVPADEIWSTRRPRSRRHESNHDKTKKMIADC